MIILFLSHFYKYNNTILIKTNSGDSMIYLSIFLLKMFENMLSTFRLIVIAHGKKICGALIQFLFAIFFIVSTSLVVIDINKDYLKLFVFGLGSLVGSYLGSTIEELIYKKKRTVNTTDSQMH